MLYLIQYIFFHGIVFRRKLFKKIYLFTIIGFSWDRHWRRSIQVQSLWHHWLSDAITPIKFKQLLSFSEKVSFCSFIFIVTAMHLCSTSLCQPLAIGSLVRPAVIELLSASLVYMANKKSVRRFRQHFGVTSFST